MKHPSPSDQTRERDEVLARPGSVGSSPFQGAFHGLFLSPPRARRLCHRRHRGGRRTLFPPGRRACGRTGAGGYDQPGRGPRRGARDAGRVPLSNDVSLRRTDNGDPRGRRLSRTPRPFPVRDRRRSPVDARVHPVPPGDRADGRTVRAVGAPTSERSAGAVFRAMGTVARTGGDRTGKRTRRPKGRRIHPRQRSRRSAASRRCRRCGTLPVPLSPNVYEGPRRFPPRIPDAPLRGTRAGVDPPGASACPGVSRRRLRRSEPLHEVVPRRIRRRSRFVSPRVRRRAISFKMKRFSSCSLRSWG